MKIYGAVVYLLQGNLIMSKPRVVPLIPRIVRSCTGKLIFVAVRPSVLGSIIIH